MIQRRGKRPITQKQKKWGIEYLTNSGNATQASKVAYPNITIKTAQTIGRNNMHNEKVRSYMREIAEEVGLDDVTMMDSLRKIVESGVSKKALGKSGTKESLMAIRMANELKDNFPAQRKQIENKNMNIRMNLEGKSQEELIEILRTQKEELQKFSEMIKQDELNNLRRNEIGNEQYYKELQDGYKQPE